LKGEKWIGVPRGLQSFPAGDSREWQTLPGARVNAWPDV